MRCRGLRKIWLLLPLAALLFVGAEAQKAARITRCPRVKVETSFIAVIDGYPMTFAAKVNGASKRMLRYRWALSNGEILEGQGTPK